MIDQDNNQTPIIERLTTHKPPRDWRSWLIGRPLSTADAAHETIGKFVGLAIFSSDAMSSVAYGPQEMLLILAVAGTQAMGMAFPLSIAIVGLLVILTLSYEQTIHAYSNGGGAYIVARDNLGELPALITGAALLMDYVLTVSVSISSGVAQIVSAYPALFQYRAVLAVVLVAFITVINLRGVKEAGAAFAYPTYFFLVLMFATAAYGFFRYFFGGLGAVVDPPHIAMDALKPISVFLILRAFSNGTTSLTGVEAISNGITAFKEPRSRNAGITLMWMSGILSALLMGIAFLSVQIHAIPSEAETVISQLVRTVYGGRNLIYTIIIISTTLILIMAANTAFAGFPRLGALVAEDGFLPRQMAFRGSRLVYSYGIVALAIIASVLIILFNASVTALIPLYAIGVFLSFTLSQAGMAHRWWKIGKLKPGEEAQERGSVLRYDSRWLPKMIVNSVGALATSMVTIIFAVTKFAEGAWIILLVTPILVGIFMLIHAHYRIVAQRLSLDNFGVIPPHTVRHRVILPVSGVHLGTLFALRYARLLSDDVTAVHVLIEPSDAEKVRKKWEKWGDGVRLVILDSPYRLFVEPLLEYISDLSNQRQPGEILTVIVPEFVSDSRLTAPLHTNTAEILRAQLKNQHGIVITNVPYHVHDEIDLYTEHIFGKELAK
ncbi:MAG: APC family permease [Anaerolineales bacterium]|nr:APC family permease [Anaerolineales bacterium]